MIRCVYLLNHHKRLLKRVADTSPPRTPHCPLSSSPPYILRYTWSTIERQCIGFYTLLLTCIVLDLCEYLAQIFQFCSVAIILCVLKICLVCTTASICSHSLAIQRAVPANRTLPCCVTLRATFCYCQMCFSGSRHLIEIPRRECSSIDQRKRSSHKTVCSRGRRMMLSHSLWHARQRTNRSECRGLRRPRTRPCPSPCSIYRGSRWMYLRG